MLLNLFYYGDYVMKKSCYVTKENSFKLTLIEKLNLKWKGSSYLSVLEKKYEPEMVVEELIEELETKPIEPVLCSSLTFNLDLDFPVKLSSNINFKKQKELGYNRGYITLQKPKDNSFSIVEQIGTLECVLNKESEFYWVHPEMMDTATFYGLNVILMKMGFEEMILLAVETKNNVLIPESDYYINFVTELGFEVTPARQFRLYKVW